jgi:hypothetical protein
MTRDSAEVVCEYWGRLMEAVKPYRGNGISVALGDTEVHPSAGYLHLVLPFGGYDRVTLGYARRPYSADVMKQLRHQAGLRLERLVENFSVDFSAPLLAIGRTPVTAEFCAFLKSPDLPDVLDVVKDPWVDEQLAGLSAALKSWPSQ